MRIQSYHKGILFASEWSHRRAPIPMFFGVLLAALVILDLASHRPDVFFVSSCSSSTAMEERIGKV